MVLCLCEFLQKWHTDTNASTHVHAHIVGRRCHYSFLILCGSHESQWQVFKALALPSEGGDVSRGRSTPFFFPPAGKHTHFSMLERLCITTLLDLQTMPLHPSSYFSSSLHLSPSTLQLWAIRTSMQENSQSLRRSKEPQWCFFFVFFFNARWEAIRPAKWSEQTPMIINTGNSKHPPLFPHCFQRLSYNHRTS